MYATTTSLEARMIGTPFDTATTALASTCIDEAEAEVNKQLGDHFDISSSYFQSYSATPPIVRHLTLNLAEAFMYERMARGGKESYVRADRLLKRTMENLKELGDGTVALLTTAGAQITPTLSKWQVASTTSDYGNTFNEDHPRRWKVDDSKLNDVAAERGQEIGDSNEVD